MNKTSPRNPLCIFVGVISIFCATLVFCDGDRPEYYDALALVPLTFGILSLLCPKIYREIPKNIGVTLLILLLFYRDVGLYFIMLFGLYGSILKYNVNVNINTAICLVIYEMIVIFITVSYVLRKDENKPFKRKIWHINSTSLFYIIIISFLIVDVMAWVSIPSLREEYRSIFDMNSDTFTEVLYHSNEHGSAEKILATLFSVTFGITRLIIPMILIHKFATWFKKHAFIGLLLTGLLIFVQLFFITSTIAFAIICCVLLLIYTSFEFPQQRKILYCSTMFGSVLFVFFYFYSRYENNPGKGMYDAATYAQVFCITQNAYFSGIDNVAANLNEGQGEYTLATMKTDITRTIPFNTTIFGKSEEESSFQLFNQNNYIYGQIPTTVGMGYSYLGFLLAPIFSFMLAYICVSSGCKLLREKNFNFAMVYLTTIMYSAMGIVMYNYSISGQYLIGVAFIMYCLLTVKGDSKKTYAKA